MSRLKMGKKKKNELMYLRTSDTMLSTEARIDGHMACRGRTGHSRMTQASRRGSRGSESVQAAHVPSPQSRR